ncbi:hypothetical protein K504DRAFT_279435 [Pleomassaria siparia CBS 279.74]|uniref:Uncharacterized protein n=1 Tax=Pleomassaria siparia CBS 279.74 TaxID=1314801 RepID=A0A6G1KA70_9PLEO|nr:hypothetical protein K504DRAFT_279435 [Pleomassaria siparia CBS 279.74]
MYSLVVSGRPGAVIDRCSLVSQEDSSSVSFHIFQASPSHLPSISRPSSKHLPHIFQASPSHLPSISLTSSKHLPHILRRNKRPPLPPCFYDASPCPAASLTNNKNLPVTKTDWPVVADSVLAAVASPPTQGCTARLLHHRLNPVQPGHRPHSAYFQPQAKPRHPISTSDLDRNDNM